MDSASDEELRKELKPIPTLDFSSLLLKKHYNITTTKVKLLDSYDDCNHLIISDNNETKYLLK